MQPSSNLLLSAAAGVRRVWSSEGWLSPYNTNQTFTGVQGYIDYAGSSVVHGIGGISALIALIILGPRYGRFGVDGGVVELEGSVVRNLVSFHL